MSLVTVYSRPDCHLCAEAMTALRGLQRELPRPSLHASDLEDGVLA